MSENSKKTINIGFIDFWRDFDYKKSTIYNLLLSSKKYNVIVSDKPDYLFFSVFGRKNLSYTNCVKIFFTGEDICPDFNICDYAFGFEYLNFEDRYMRYPLYYTNGFSADYELMMSKKNVDKKRKDFCSFVYSNPGADETREYIFRTLNKYKHVNSGGNFLNNIGENVDNKLEFEMKHKFSLAIENVTHPGYTTEKIVQSFAAGCVPIYWGDPLISKVFNSKSFINLMEYSSINEGLKKVIEIDNNEELYNKMLTEKPILNDEYLKENIDKLLLQKLEYIFDQDKEQAYRTSRKFKNNEYIQERRKEYIFSKRFYPLFKFSNLLLKIFKQ